MKKYITIASIIFNIIALNVYTQNCVQCSGTTADGETASAIGIDNTASGKASFAGGIDSEALDRYTLAFGDSAIAWSRNGIALGKQVSVFGPYSFGVGENLKTTITSSMVIGSGFDDYNPLVNGIGKSIMIGFNSNKSTLFVEGALSNGYTGKVGIGDVTSPESKLHILADDGETAEAYIQWSNTNAANLWLGTKQYGLKATYNKLEFKTSPGGRYIFYDGNVGIGTNTASEKLEVNGNINISKGYALFADRIQGPGQKGLNLTGITGIGIYVTYNGKVGIGLTNPSTELEVNGKTKSSSMQITTGYGNGKLLQSDAVGNAIWTNPAWIISGNNVYRTTGNVGIGTTATNNRLEVAGTVNATNFVGNGSGLTNIPGDNLGDHIATQNIHMNGKWLSGDGGDEGLFVKNDGNVGIGLSVPARKLDIAGELRVYNIIEGNQNGGYNKLIVKGCDNANSSLIEIFKGGTPESRSIKLITRDGGDIQFSTSSTRRMIIRDDEIVIGQADVQKHVDVRVNGHVLCREVEVTPTEWYDQVFDSDYQLTALNDLEKFIMDHGHLPEIPTDEQVMENGINVGEMQALLLKKIEELTLYVIELKNENYEMKRDIVELKNDKL